jgi:LEA14-like dessication related protein
MGVTVTEQYDLGCGLDVNSYYASINMNDIRMVKREEHRNHQYDPESVTTTTKYNLEAGFTFWVSQAARTSGKEPIGRTHISVSQETPITENLYTVLYAKFKELHPTAVDA